MSALLLMLLLGLAGMPLSLLLCGPRAEALPAAPLIGAGLLAAAATFEVAFGGPPLGLALIALVLGSILPASRLWARRMSVRPVRPWFELSLLVTPTLVLGWTLSTLQRVQVSYDGRSIWFFHARMLTGGHSPYLSQASAFPFSHPDYPPLVPASVSLSWRLAGTVDYRTGQLTLAALTACATVLAVLGVARALDQARWEAPVSAAVGVAVLYGVWDEYATNGFVDPLCAGLVLAAMVHGLLVRPDRRRTPLALGLVVLAAFSKNEGLTFVLVVMAAIFVRQVLERGAGERVPWRVFVGVLGLVLAWPAVAHVHGIPSDLTSGSQLVGDAARPLPRLKVVLEFLGHLLPGVTIGLMGLVAVSVLVHRQQRGRIALLLAAQLLCALALLGVYAFGPLEIHYWVNSSLFRTSMTLRAGGLLAAVYAAAVAAQVVFRTRRGEDVETTSSLGTAVVDPPRR